MLNCAYKIYAKSIALRLCNHMKDWINKEQKGFIKGRYIPDAITAIWEGMELTNMVGKMVLFAPWWECSFDLNCKCSRFPGGMTF